MTNQLNQIMEMVNSKKNIFMIVECADSIGFELNSRSLPGLKMEVSALIENAAAEEEAQSLVITF